MVSKGSKRGARRRTRLGVDESPTTLQIFPRTWLGPTVCIRPGEVHAGDGDGLAVEDVPGGGFLLRHVQVLPGTAVAVSQRGGERGSRRRAGASRPAKRRHHTAACIHLRFQPFSPAGMGARGRARLLHAVPALQSVQEGGRAGGLEWRLLGEALLGGAGAGRRGAGGTTALRAGPWSERGAGGEKHRVAGPHVSAAIAGVGAATFPVGQLDEALEREGGGGGVGGGGGGAARRSGRSRWSWRWRPCRVGDDWRSRSGSTRYED